MNLRKTIFVVLALCLFPAYASASLEDIHISLLEGDVQVKTADTDDWVPASINLPLREGDRVWVPEGGRTELRLKEGTYLRLDEKTSFDILRMEGDSAQFYLGAGRVYADFRGTRYRLLQLDTPISSLRIYERSVFRVDVFEDGFTDVSVFKGSVLAEGKGGNTRVNAGKMLSLREDTYAELSPLGPSDEWERWNRERDRVFAERRYSSTYLPKELDPYAPELDSHGKWVHVRDYGYCWTPISISVGWSPYRHGRWVWVGGDYVWISYEPWGWAPYHYGRWAFVDSRWCWVPPVRGDVFWSPGYVAWVYTSDYVSWVPLAPREIYYGYGHFGRFSVNIVNVNINTVVVDRTFRNASVRDAVVIFDRAAFLSGRPASVTVRENPFFTQRISVGRPLITPERATRIPVFRDIPAAKQPPRVVREIQVKELLQRRPIVKERAGSVLQPQAPQRTMPLRIYKEPRGAESRTFIEKGASPGRERRTGPAERQQRPAVERPKEQKRELPLERPQRQDMERSKERRPVAPEQRQKQEIERPAAERPPLPAERSQRQEIEKKRERSSPPVERPKVERQTSPEARPAPAEQKERGGKELLKGLKEQKDKEGKEKGKEKEEEKPRR